MLKNIAAIIDMMYRLLMPAPCFGLCLVKVSPYFQYVNSLRRRNSSVISRVPLLSQTSAKAVP